MGTPAPTTAPEYWTCDVVLVGGGTVRVRSIEPEDPRRWWRSTRPSGAWYHSTAPPSPSRCDARGDYWSWTRSTACSACPEEAITSAIEAEFDYLDAPPARLAYPDTPIPYSKPLEQSCLPDPDAVAPAARQLIDR